MALRDFLPDWSVAILFAAFWLSSNESGSVFWSRIDARVGAQVSDMLFQRQGPHFAKVFFGDSWFDVVVSVTYWLGWLFVIAFLIAYAYDGGWRRAVGLLLIAMAAYVLYGVCAVLLGAEELGQIAGTAAAVSALALMLALAFMVAWFGLRSGSSA